jgi:hypothetical protein
MALKTAVDWLFDQLPEHLRLSENGFDMLQQATEMFKQQIESAYKMGDGVHDEVANELSKKYYTKTYGK